MAAAAARTAHATFFLSKAIVLIFFGEKSQRELRIFTEKWPPICVCFIFFLLCSPGEECGCRGDIYIGRFWQYLVGFVCLLEFLVVLHGIRVVILTLLLATYYNCYFWVL